MKEDKIQKITPFLWFDTQAEEAANYYVAIFPESKIESITRYGDAGPGPKGQVLTVDFRLFGQSFVALNGGPMFKFTEAVSFVVNCDNQEEVDKYWNKLTKDGEESMCGWLKDKYGLSWQIIPQQLPKLLNDKDPEKAGRVIQAMMKMRKIELPVLEKAYESALA